MVKARTWFVLQQPMWHAKSTRLFLSIFIGSLASAAHAAWLQEPGHGIIIGSLIDQYATAGFDVNGEERPLFSYRVRRAQTYLAYGLEDTPFPLTVGANLTAAQARQLGEHTQAIEDPELFARAQLYKGRTRLIALEPFVKLPSSTSDTNTRLLGNVHTDAGARILYGHSFTLLGYTHFSQTSAGYRYRGGPLEDQWQFEETLGLSLGGGWQFLAQGFVTQSTGDFTNGMGLALSSAGDYDVSKAQLSLLIPLEEQIKLQIGYGWDIDGVNTIKTKGWSLGLWRNF